MFEFGFCNFEGGRLQRFLSAVRPLFRGIIIEADIDKDLKPRSFALPAECVVSLLPLALPAVAWQRIAPGFLPRLRERILYAAMNYGVMLLLRNLMEPQIAQPFHFSGRLTG